MIYESTSPMFIPYLSSQQYEALPKKIRDLYQVTPVVTRAEPQPGQKWFFMFPGATALSEGTIKDLTPATVEIEYEGLGFTTTRYPRRSVKFVERAVSEGAARDGKEEAEVEDKPLIIGPFVIGNWYECLNGEMVHIIGAVVESKGYETVVDHLGHHRYATRDFGRCTGCAVDDPRNLRMPWPTGQIRDEEIDRICAPDRAVRWKQDGQQYDRDTIREFVSKWPLLRLE